MIAATVKPAFGATPFRESIAKVATTKVHLLPHEANSMKHPDFDRAQEYALRRLHTELPPKLYYHGVHHTRDDVLPAVERLATMAGVTGEPLLLLRTAALYHDIGWIERRRGHEEIGVRIAQEVLPRFGYNSAQLRAICSMIRATRVPQSPQTPLEELLCDADLDSLGREDFFVTSQLLRLEMLAHGRKISLCEWHKIQLEFLTTHNYFSATARELRGPGKQKNIQEVRELLNCSKGSLRLVQS
jgi:uncharacterized protein